MLTKTLQTVNALFMNVLKMSPLFRNFQRVGSFNDGPKFLMLNLINYLYSINRVQHTVFFSLCLHLRHQRRQSSTRYFLINSSI